MALAESAPTGPFENLHRGRAAQRQPMPPALLRYALACGLNGQPLAAERALRAICRMNIAERCDEARQSWQVLQARYPPLATIPAP